MSVQTKDKIMELVKGRIGDDTSDESIALIEDISDTFTDLEAKAKGDGEDWKAKYEALDNEWRTKYTERFFSPDPDGDELGKPNEEDNKPLTYEDLFKEN